MFGIQFVKNTVLQNFAFNWFPLGILRNCNRIAFIAVWFDFYPFSNTLPLLCNTHSMQKKKKETFNNLFIILNPIISGPI